jgi:hypothetical protein
MLNPKAMNEEQLLHAKKLVALGYEERKAQRAASVEQVKAQAQALVNYAVERATRDQAQEDAALEKQLAALEPK